MWFVVYLLRPRCHRASSMLHEKKILDSRSVSFWRLDFWMMSPWCRYSRRHDRIPPSVNQRHSITALGHRGQDKENSPCLRYVFSVPRREKLGQDAVWGVGWLVVTYFFFSTQRGREMKAAASPMNNRAIIEKKKIKNNLHTWLLGRKRTALTLQLWRRLRGFPRQR